ncbi:MAG: Dyp-type peroxidase [Candidatus Dormibacteria bacterium]
MATTPQPGIFAVGTAAHSYLEFDLLDGADPGALIATVSRLEEPRTTVGGVNFVSGFRPSILRVVAPSACPTDAADFGEALVGIDGFTMPATQHDAFVWVSGAAPDLVFDVALQVVDALADVASLASEVGGWSYRHSRDLTGFEDGTENPPIPEAHAAAVVPEGQPGAGSSVLLVQKWKHLSSWRDLSDEAQEQAMGRTKPDSVELDPLPEDSHVARTVIEVDGEEQEIFRRNTPYGTLADYGTMFIGFASTRALLHRMLERMAGAEDGIRDALTLHTLPLSGSYYVVPALEVLDSLATAR